MTHIINIRATLDENEWFARYRIIIRKQKNVVNVSKLQSGTAHIYEPVGNIFAKFHSRIAPDLVLVGFRKITLGAVWLLNVTSKVSLFYYISVKILII